jgi:transcriptional regulator with XRE-family HTH domain
MVITMSEIAKTVGQRIRNYRTQLGYSQEKLAELSGCHPTYIGQLERGEKNATLESVEKISSALGVTLSKLFEMIGDTDSDAKDIPRQCYEFIAAKTPNEQEQIYKILIEMDKYKNK